MLDEANPAPTTRAQILALVPNGPAFVSKVQ